jgi:hypothetical protein
MSGLDIPSTNATGVNTRLWGKNGQSQHSMVHPKHPMRLCKTIEVQSLKEMKQTLPMGSPIVDTLGLQKNYNYLLNATNEKVVIGHNVYNITPGFIKIAQTILTTEEFLNTENAVDALLGSLRLALDAIEAQVWYLIFTGGFGILLPLDTSSGSLSYRELLAYGRAAIHRIAGTDNVHVLTPVIHYAAMLLDNTAGITASQQSAVTEHHLYDAPRATIIPLAHNTSYFINNVVNSGDTGLHDEIGFYPDYLPSLITRYVYEYLSIERVKERSQDRNLRRVVLERYLTLDVPFVYDQIFAPAVPFVYLFARTALNNVIAKYDNGFDNLSAIASF